MLTWWLSYCKTSFVQMRLVYRFDGFDDIIKMSFYIGKRSVNVFFVLSIFGI